MPSSDNFSSNMTSVSDVTGASNETINLVSVRALEDQANDNSLLLRLSFTPTGFSFSVSLPFSFHMSFLIP